MSHGYILAAGGSAPEVKAVKSQQLQRGWMYRHRHVQMELLLVLAIIVVLTGISAITYARVAERVRQTADSINVRVLNDKTTALALIEGTSKDRVFDPEAARQEPMQRLVAAGLLGEAIEPQQPEHQFHWVPEEVRWRVIPNGEP